MKRLLLIGALAALVAGIWWVGRDGGATGAAEAQVILPETFSDQAKIGEAVFNARCAACHGPNASGVEGKGPPLIHKIYEPNHHGDAAIFMAARQGARAHHWPYGDMPPVEGITDAEIGAVITYLREVQRANGIN